MKPPLQPIACGLLGVLITGVLFAGPAFAGTPASDDDPRLHRPKLLDLLRVDKRGGKELRIPKFNLARPDALWQNQPHMYWDYHPGNAGNPPHWFLNPEPYAREWLARGLWSERNIRIKPNRRYLISALIRADFNRKFAELNIGLEAMDAEASPIAGRRDVGFPADTTHATETNGWTRFEAVLTTPPNENIVLGRPRFQIYLGAEYPRNADETVDFPFGIADLTIVELPEAAADADTDPIDMVTFAGGPGNLPMQVDAVDTEAGDGTMKVTVTGVDWVIDPATSTIAAHQRIDFPRPLATWTLDQPLEGLNVVRQDDTVAVLQNEHVTLGVQCDGMLAMYPHQATQVRVESHVKTPFTRFGDGHLLATDGRGGFATHLYPVLGSGRMPDARPITDGLDFVDFDRPDLQTLSDEPAGWEIAWSLEHGERLFLSAFPPRPYDWEQSFDLMWQLTNRGDTQDLYTRDWVAPANVFLLWAFHAREWGMSFGDSYVSIDPDEIREHLEWVRETGKKAIFYTSAWFFTPREPEVYVDAVVDEIETYGFDGFYSDGLPAIEWLVGYEQMRMLREQLDTPDRDAMIVIHDSVPQSGRHPAGLTPFIYTYPTATYMAEHTSQDNVGPDWSWVRYVIGQFRVANSIGTLKADAWESDQFTRDMDKFLAGLIWGARRGEHGGVDINEVYVPAERELKALWKQHGDDPHFYDRYYVQRARELAGFHVGPTAMPIVEPGKGGVALRSMTPDATIHFTLDGSEPTTDSPVYTEPIAADLDAVRAIAVAEGLEPSPPTP